MNRIKMLLITGLVLIFYLSNVMEAKEGVIFEGLYFPKETTQQRFTNILLEDFENCDAWRAIMPPGQGFARAKKVLGGSTNIKNGNYCLAIKEWCYKRGFNWTEIKPPVPITITGSLKGLSIWVLGRNFRHRLEIWIKNYQGIEYRIDMGGLNFKGWRKLSAKIPMFIPYYTKYIPQYKNSYITRFVVRHDPDEKNGIYYVYLDDFSAIIDIFEDKYDGDDMINEMGIERYEEVTPSLEEVKGTEGGG